MSDLVERLRTDPEWRNDNLLKDAADEIERLQGQVKSLYVGTDMLRGEIERLQKQLRNKACDFTDCKALKRERRLRAALERAYNAGHNDDCLFCGFKDRIITEALDKLREVSDG